jgi:hypothetical protein
VLSLKPADIHVAWWVIWIGLAQDWVRQQMETDKHLLEDEVRRVIAQRHPKWRAMECESFDALFEDVRKGVLERRDDLARFDSLPPPMLVMWDVRAQIRSSRQRSKGEDEDSSSREGAAHDSHKGKGGQKREEPIQQHKEGSKAKATHEGEQLRTSTVGRRSSREGKSDSDEWDDDYLFEKPPRTPKPSHSSSKGNRRPQGSLTSSLTTPLCTLSVGVYLMCPPCCVCDVTCRPPQ